MVGPGIATDGAVAQAFRSTHKASTIRAAILSSPRAPTAPAVVQTSIGIVIQDDTLVKLVQDTGFVEAVDGVIKDGSNSAR